jgi:hypothetical protein
MEFAIQPKGLAARTGALTLIALFHIVLIYLANKHFSLKREASRDEVLLHFINHPVLIVPSQPEISAPDFSVSRSRHSPNLPEIDRLQIEADTADYAEPPTYAFPERGSEKFQHLFDPRPRERLQNLKHFTKSKTRSIDGIQILDLGNGRCELTFVGSSKRGLPSESVEVKCGNNESEQMVENMEKALADPLGLK